MGDQKESKPKPTLVTLKCLKCGEEFKSKDRTRNRLCRFCNQDNSTSLCKEEIKVSNL